MAATKVVLVDEETHARIGKGRESGESMGDVVKRALDALDGRPPVTQAAKRATATS